MGLGERTFSTTYPEYGAGVPGCAFCPLASIGTTVSGADMGITGTFSSPFGTFEATKYLSGASSIEFVPRFQLNLPFGGGVYGYAAISFALGE